MTYDLPDLDPLRPHADLAAGLDAIIDELADVTDLDDRRRRAGPLLARLSTLLDAAPESAYAEVAARRMVPDRADAINPTSCSWTSGPGGLSNLRVTWPAPAPAGVNPADTPGQ